MEKFSITKELFYFVLSPVKYFNVPHTVLWSIEPMDGAKLRSYDQWLDRFNGSGFQLPSGPLTMEVIETLKREEAGPCRDVIAEMQESLKRNYHHHLLMTGTRVKYGKDIARIVHDYKTPDQRDLYGNMSQHTGMLEIHNDPITRGLLGTDVERTRSTIRCISNRSQHLEIPKKSTGEGTLLLGVDSDRFKIVVSDYDVRPAFAVHVRKMK